MSVLTTERFKDRSVEQGEADDSAYRPCFSLAGLLGDLGRHPELDLDTLAYHLRQSDATAADGYWHAAINEARSFLEALLVGIMHAVGREAPPDPSRNGSPNGTPFRSYRRYLTELGFLDADENVLLQSVYGVASAKGSHHGVTDEAWSRLARRMVYTTGQYVIHRYETWKRNGCAHGGNSAAVAGSSRRSSRGSWWGMILRHLGAGRGG